MKIFSTTTPCARCRKPSKCRRSHPCADALGLESSDCGASCCHSGSTCRCSGTSCQAGGVAFIVGFLALSLLSLLRLLGGRAKALGQHEAVAKPLPCRKVLARSARCFLLGSADDADASRPCARRARHGEKGRHHSNERHAGDRAHCLATSEHGNLSGQNCGATEASHSCCGGVCETE